MQKIFDAKVAAGEYQSQGKDYLYPDLTGDLCPQCKGDLLRRHGFYSRYLILLQDKRGRFMRLDEDKRGTKGDGSCVLTE